jgi:integrase
MANLFKPTYTTTDQKTGARVQRRAAKWYGQYKEANGDLHRVPLSKNKTAAQQMLNALVRKSELGKAGIADPFEDQRKRPLADHLADFRRYLEAKGNTEKHARQTCNRVEAVLSGCRLTFLADLSASALVEWLAGERAAGRMGIQTSNYYLRDTKAFCRWLVKDRRTADNPLAHVSGMNAQVEDGLERRAMPAEEFAALVDAAGKGKTVRKLAGPERAMLYTIAAYTGLRESELASLTPESFDLAADSPMVNVEAAYSKRRRHDSVPLRADLAELLRGWLADKAAGEPIWPGAWWRHGAKMIRADLAAARRQWIADAKANVAEVKRREQSFRFCFEDETGRRFDFHALRHQFISNLVAAGVHPKVAQTLARHSTITLTMDCYSHIGLFDQSAALDKLPSLPASTEPQTERMRATGTDGACTGACTKLAQEVDSGCEGVTLGERNEPGAGVVASSSNRRELRTHESDCEGVIEIGPSRIRTGDGGFAIRCLSRLAKGPLC